MSKKLRSDNDVQTAEIHGAEDRCAVLEMEISALKKAAEDNLNLAKYHKAEFENYKKRNAESSIASYNDGKASVIMQILPLHDSLIEGLKTVETDKDKEGIEILIRKFSQILTVLGVEEIKTVGESFDPRVHNAIAAEVTAGVPPDMVTQELQRGYKLGGKMIREALVKVSK